ncbi:MAG: type II secretory pathway component GspD/PulD (secretin) [Planctomycetota bacterium]|jgi:type II secretory pathway component GspD/PulD (secretin)
MLNSIALAAALTLGTTLAVPQMPTSRAITATAGIFPLATEALVFDPEQSMADLVAEYARLTGQSAAISEETMSFLSNSKVRVSPAATVPPAMVQEVFEQVMLESHFVLGIVSDMEPRMFSLVNLNTGRRTTLRSSARYVARQDLEVYRNHPALMISTVVALPNTDVRQLSNSMRTMITDANVQQMLPAGAGNSMVVTGFGRSTVELVDMLERIDASRAAGAIANPELFEIMPLKHAVAQECIPLLESLLGSKGKESMELPQGLRVVADMRTNSLLVRGHAGQMADVRRVLSLLDQKL